MTKLESKLENCNKDLWALYLIIKQGFGDELKCSDIQKEINPWNSISDYYTLHGYQHSYNVLLKLDYLLINSELNCYELFYILSAVWIHDIGMIKHKHGANEEKIRKLHHLSSIEYFNNFFAPEYLENKVLPGKTSFNELDKNAINMIVKYHRKSENIQEIEEYFDRDGITNRVFLRYISSVFRIADGLELDKSRAPYHIYDKFKNEFPYLDEIFWKKHFPIISIIPNIENRGQIEINFTSKLNDNLNIHYKDLTSILLQISNDIIEEISSVGSEIFPSLQYFNDKNKIFLSNIVFIDNNKTANDPERVFIPKQEIEPCGWRINEITGWKFPFRVKERLIPRTITTCSEVDTCFVETSITKKFLECVREDYTKSYYLESFANTGKSSLLNVASWNVFKNNNGIRSYVVQIENKIPSYIELINHLTEFFYVNTENFICIFDGIERISYNHTNPDQFINLVNELKENGHTVWGSGRTWNEFHNKDIWSDQIKKEFTVNPLPGLLYSKDLENFVLRFHPFFDDVEKYESFCKLMKTDIGIEVDSVSKLYEKFSHNHSKLSMSDINTLTEEFIERTKIRYLKIYQTLTQTEFKIYCLVYKFPGIFNFIVDSIISTFNGEKCRYTLDMVSEGKIETNFHPIYKKDKKFVAFLCVVLNDESKIIMENDNSIETINNTCNTILSHFFDKSLTPSYEYLYYFYTKRLLMNKELINKYTDTIIKNRKNIHIFYILSLLARENSALSIYNKEIRLFNENESDILENITVNFCIALANKNMRSEFIKNLKCVRDSQKLLILAADVTEIDYSLISLTKALELKPSSEKICSGIGMLFKELKSYDKAIEALYYTYDLFPDNANYLYQIAICQYELKHYDDSLDSLSKAIEQNNDENYWYLKGVIYEETGQYNDAISSYNNAIKINHEFPLPWLGLGIVYRHLKQYKKASDAVAKSIELDSNSKHSWYLKGEIAFENNSFKEALEAFNKVISIDEYFKEAHNCKLTSMLFLNMYSEIIELSNLSIENNFFIEIYLYFRCEAYFQQEDYTNALQDIDKILEFNSTDAKKLYIKCQILEKMKKFEEALVIINETIRIDPSNYLYFYQKGSLQQDLNNIIDALESLDLSIKLNPKNTLAWNLKGNIQLDLGKLEDALYSYNKAILSDPEYRQSWNGKGNTLNDLGKFEEAIIAYKRAISIDPNFQFPWNGIGNAYMRLSKYNKAIEYYGEAIRLDSGDPNAWIGRGNAYSMLSNHLSAVKEYNKAIKLDSTNIVCYFNRGMNYISLKEYSKAEKSFKKILDIDPTNLLSISIYLHTLISNHKNEEAKLLLQNCLDNEDLFDSKEKLHLLHIILVLILEGSSNAKSLVNLYKNEFFSSKNIIETSEFDYLVSTLSDDYKNRILVILELINNICGTDKVDDIWTD